METVRKTSGRQTPERPLTVIIMDGTQAVYAGFADSGDIKKIIEIMERKNRRIPIQ